MNDWIAAANRIDYLDAITTIIFIGLEVNPCQELGNQHYFNLQILAALGRDLLIDR